MTDNSTPASRLLIADAAELNRLAAAWPAWQPIATAPKDGTEIDLLGSCGRETGCHWGRQDWEIDNLGWPEESVGWVGYSERYSCYGRVDGVTHWMPIPPVTEPTT